MKTKLSRTCEARHITLFRMNVVRLGQGRVDTVNNQTQNQEASQTQNQTQSQALQLAQATNENIVALAKGAGEQFEKLTHKIQDLTAQVQALQPKKRVKKKKLRERDVFSDELVELLTNKIMNKKASLKQARNLLVIFVLFATGIRCNETGQLTITSLTNLATQQTTEILESKTKKTRTLVISKKHAQTLKAAVNLFKTLNARKNPTVQNKENLSIWYNYSKKEKYHHKSVLRAVNAELKNLLNEIYQSSSTNEPVAMPKISSHSGRISFVTRLFKQKHQAHEIQQLVGHKNVQTTLMYSRVRLNVNEKINLLDQNN